MLAAGTLIVSLAAPAQANHPTSGPIKMLPADADDNTISHCGMGGLNGHKPGQPDVTPAQFAHDVARLAKHCDLITLTEIVTPQRANALRLNGFGLCWHPGADTGVLYTKAIISVKWCRDRSVSDVRYYSNMGHRWVLPTRITAAMLTVKSTGKTMLVSVAHAVSCAFSRHNDGWIPGNQLCATGRTTASRTYIQQNLRRVAAYKAHMEGWQEWDKQLIQTYHPDVILRSGDFNLDFKKDWVREYLARVWKDSAIGWKKWSKSDYTHLMRTYHGTYKVLLDGTLLAGEGATFAHGSVSYPETRSSDHSPFEDIIRFGA
jgi:hypothetical protein